MELAHLTLHEARQGLARKEFSSFELTQSFLKRINKYNSDINSYLSVYSKEALKQAKEFDDADVIKTNPLAGLPLAIKDNILIEGGIVTAGSKILENYQASFTATAVKRLKECGAIILGKTNLDEFAMGSSTENSAFGVTKNPWDTKKVPGGTSGGSASAVTADLCLSAIGSDTGGSIRQPASFCGCVGYKPTYGIVSRYGLIAMASSFDQIGPLAKTVKDAALLIDCMAGHDTYDSTTTTKNLENFVDGIAKFKPSGMTIGMPKEYFSKDLDSQVAELIQDEVLALESQGIKVKEVSLPLTKYNLPVYYIIMPSEVSSNLGRYDGIRYGFSDRSGKTLESVYINTKSNGFGQEVKRRILIGTYSLSSGYYEAYYGRAQKARNLIKKEFEDVFKEVDLLITPTAPGPAFDIGAKTASSVDMYMQDIFTVSANVAGLPALSLPVGLVNGLPVGLQIIGPRFADLPVLGLANILEQQIAFSRLEYV